MSFNGLKTTAGPPQWPGEARPEAAPEPGETAHLAQKNVGSLLFRAGGGLGGPATAGGGRERAGQRPPGPAGNKAARDSGKNTEQRGRTPGAIAAPFAQDQPALARRGPTRTTGLGTRAPPGRWEQGACEGETRGAERDAGS